MIVSITDTSSSVRLDSTVLDEEVFVEMVTSNDPRLESFPPVLLPPGVLGGEGDARAGRNKGMLFESLELR